MHKYAPEHAKDFNETAITTYDKVAEKIREYSKEKVVVAKSMSTVIQDYYNENKDFFKDPNRKFVFIIRDLGDIISSFSSRFSSEKYQHQLNDIDSLKRFLNIKALSDFFKIAKENAKDRTYLMRAEDLYNKPQATLRAFCKTIGAKPKDDMHKFPAYGKDFMQKNKWEENRTEETARHWSGTAIESSEIGKPTSYDKVTEKDKNGIYPPTFAEQTDDNKRKVLFELYNQMLPYYVEMLNDKKHYIKS